MVCCLEGFPTLAMVWIKRTRTEMSCVLAGECMACEESDAHGHNGAWELRESLDERGEVAVWGAHEGKVCWLSVQGLHPDILPFCQCLFLGCELDLSWCQGWG